MRDGSVIAIGKGNPDWNFSGPHGAGRIMSRTEAKKNLSLLDYQNIMKGISSRTVCQNTIDEAPQVYKNAKEIENLISETVQVQKHLKVIANYKGF
jgi:RNA-splicing ligase RtcB